MLRYLIIAVVMTAASARVADDARTSDDVALSDFKIAYETYKECSATDMTTCLKVKLAKALTRIGKNDELTLVDGVTLVRDKSVEAPREQEIEAALPRSLEDQETTLNSIILDKIVGFFSTHTLQIKFPGTSELQRAFEEGRGRRRRLAPLILIPLFIGGTLVPLAFGALALLAGKALIVSKLALVLSGIIGLKKLLSPGGGGHEAHEVVVQAGHGGGNWGRNLEEAQNLAYKAHTH